MRSKSIFAMIGLSAFLATPLGAMAQNSPTGTAAVTAAQGSMGGTTSGTGGFSSAFRSHNPVGAAAAGIIAGGGSGTPNTTGTIGSTGTAGTMGTTGMTGK